MGTVAHMQKVYGTLALGIGIAAELVFRRTKERDRRRRSRRAEDVAHALFERDSLGDGEEERERAEGHAPMRRCADGPGPDRTRILPYSPSCEPAELLCNR